MSSQHGNQQVTTIPAPPSIPSWWSWRPGIAPKRALLIGGCITLFALLLTVVSLYTLISGILDTTAPLQHVPGTVTGKRDRGALVELTLNLQQHDYPTTTTLLVTPAVAGQIALQQQVAVDYTPHLEVPHFIEVVKQRYLLPIQGLASFFPGGMLLLLLLGLGLLIYPALLARWGWHDFLVERYDPDQRCVIEGTVVARRQVTTTRAGRPGRITARTQHWYGIAIQPPTQQDRHEDQPLTFRLYETAYHTIEEGERVRIIFSPSLHYVYSIKQI